MTLAPVVRIGSRALIRLEEAIYVMKHYWIVNHKPASSQLPYDPVIKNFKLEFDSIKDRKKKEVSTLHVSQKLDIVRWTENLLIYYQGL